MKDYMKNFSLMRRLKKMMPAIAFMALMSLLTVTAVAAPIPAGPVAGCDPANAKLQENQAAAMRVRDKAYSMAIIKRNDPSLGMTCFDKAMGVTSRLGNIFSDKLPTVSGIVNTAVFTGGAGDSATSMMKMFTNGSGGTLLVNSLDNVVTPVLSNFLGNFGGTLSALGGLGTTVGNALSAITGAINGALTSLTSAVGSVTGTISTAIGYINQITTIANQLGIAMPQGALLAILSVLQGVQSAINAALAAAVSAINAVVAAAMSAIMALLSSLTNMACDNIKSLWSDGDPSNAMKSIEGSGIEDGTPYFDYRQLLSGNPAGASQAMRDEMATPFNAGVLNTALNDLNNSLNAPCGGLRSWKRPPVITAGMNLAAVIGLMADPCP